MSSPSKDERHLLRFLPKRMKRDLRLSFVGKDRFAVDDTLRRLSFELRRAETGFDHLELETTFRSG